MYISMRLTVILRHSSVIFPIEHLVLSIPATMACPKNCPKVRELLAATYWFWTFSVGFLVFTVLSVFVGFYTPLWWIIPVYVAYIVLDRETPEKGGRPVKFFRGLGWFRLMKSYFQHRLIVDEGAVFNADKHYIFACYPHGVLPAGPFAAFATEQATSFPHHQTLITALGVQFWVPIIRELYLMVGAISVSAASIRYALRTDRTSGDGRHRIVSIMIGGADEAKFVAPGRYKIILLQRKGFVKMALQTGAPLVPVLTFGEPDVFRQIQFPGFAVIQQFVKSVLGVGLVIPIGKYVVCPRRVPLTTVVGKPIDMVQTDKPSNEDVDALHAKFVDAIVALFDDNKGKYLKDSEKAVLEIV